MDTDRVRDHFQEEALAYDEAILRLVPRYHEQHGILLSLLPFTRDQPLRVLDLGCGTGVLSHVVLEEFARATGVAFDLTENMLVQAKKRLRRFADRVSFQQGDFGKDEIGKGYDLVISGFAIHHLTNAAKQELYRRIFESLNPGGVFLHREIVAGATPALNALYERLWRDFVASQGERDDGWFRKYFEEDIPAPVEDQVEWLKQVGFVDVACHWRHFNFAIFGGTKA